MMTRTYELLGLLVQNVAVLVDFLDHVLFLLGQCLSLGLSVALGLRGLHRGARRRGFEVVRHGVISNAPRSATSIATKRTCPERPVCNLRGVCAGRLAGS